MQYFATFVFNLGSWLISTDRIHKSRAVYNSLLPPDRVFDTASGKQLLRNSDWLKKFFLSLNSVVITSHQIHAYYHNLFIQIFI